MQEGDANFTHHDFLKHTTIIIEFHNNVVDLNIMYDNIKEQIARYFISLE